MGRRGEAPLVPPYRLRCPNKEMAFMAPVVFKAGLLSEPVPIRCAGCVSLAYLLIETKPTFNVVDSK